MEDDLGGVGVTGALKAVLEDFKGHPSLLALLIFNVLILGSAGWYLQHRAERTERFVSDVIERCLPVKGGST